MVCLEKGDGVHVFDLAHVISLTCLRIRNTPSQEKFRKRVTRPSKSRTEGGHSFTRSPPNRVARSFQVSLGSGRSGNISSEPERSKPVRVRLAQAVLRDSETNVPKKNVNARKKTVETRLGALRTDLGALQAEVKNGMGDVGDVAGERAGAVVQSAGELAERALRLAEETAMDWAGDVEDWTSDNVESARDSVRTQPLAAIALAVGAGALIGAIFLRR